MRLEEFEELVKDFLADITSNSSVVISEEGEVVIYTNLTEDLECDLVEFDNEDDDFEDDEETEKLKKEEDDDDDDDE